MRSSLGDAHTEMYNYCLFKFTWNSASCTWTTLHQKLTYVSHGAIHMDWWMVLYKNTWCQIV